MRPSDTFGEDWGDIDSLEGTITSSDSFSLINRVGDLFIQLLDLYVK
jgi:hypothetical protein